MTNKSCYSYTFLRFCELNLNGSTDSIGALGVDVNNWGVLKIINHKPNFVLIYNNDTIYTLNQESTIGNIFGLGLTSQGTAEYDYVKLYNGSGKLTYSNDFD